MNFLPISDSSASHLPSARGEPAWELALHYPRQGDWTEADYLELIESNQNVELIDGCLEFLPMPNFLHQLIARYIFEQLRAHVKDHGSGEVLFPTFPVHLGDRNFRIPDVVYLKPEHCPALDKTPDGADLVVEIVSKGKASPERDHQTKRTAYAKAGIDEYWIVDPGEGTVHVLTRDDREYRKHG